MSTDPTNTPQSEVFIDGQTFEWPVWSKAGVRELRNEFELGYDSPAWDDFEEAVAEAAAFDANWS